MSSSVTAKLRKNNINAKFCLRFFYSAHHCADRLIYSEGAYDLELRYDGSLYTLVDEGRSASFPHLIVDVETDPPARVKFHHAVHYLLSQDPEMTQQRYFAHMVSSAYQPEFPETRGLFSLYDTEP